MSSLLEKGRRFSIAWKFLSPRMTAVVSMIPLTTISLAWLTQKIFIQKRTKFDEFVFRYLQKHTSERNNQRMLAITALGKHQFFIPANLALIAYYSWIRKNKQASIKVPVIALSSLGLMFLLKFIFHRQRPGIPLLEDVKGLSFPSGHALMSVTFYGLLIYSTYLHTENKLVKWTVINSLLVLIFLIGFSRIYLRVHYASDVIAGYMIGFLWLVIMIWLLNLAGKHPIKEREFILSASLAT